MEGKHSSITKVRVMKRSFRVTPPHFEANFWPLFFRSGSVARLNDPNWKICSFICIGFPPQTCVFMCVRTHMPTHCAIVAHVRTEAWGRIHEHWNEHGKGLPGFWVSLVRWEELNWVGSVLFLLGKMWLRAQIPGFSLSWALVPELEYWRGKWRLVT